MKAKHRTIFNALKEQIDRGKYSESRRLPSEAELARHFNVSRPTAARALRDLQSIGIINRQAGSGSYLNDSSDWVLPRSKHTFGLLVPGLGNTEILDPICNELTRFGQSLGAEILWGDSAHPITTPEDALALCNQYIERRVNGVFFAPIEVAANRAAANKEISKKLSEAGIAIILIDRDILEFPARSQFDLIGIDNFTAGLILTNHLIALGNRTFRFLARPDYPSTTNLRLAGCREAIASAELKQPQRLAWFGEPDNLEFVRQMISPTMPDAVICSNDQTAAKLIQTFSSMGVRLPEDVRIAGFDDVRYATLLTVPLTTIHQPCAAMARAAMRAMQERIRHPDLATQEILLPFKLMIRKSCGSGEPKGHSKIRGRSSLAHTK